MYIRLLKIIKLFVLACVLSSIAFGIENSVVDQMDAKKCMEQFKDKFSEKQYRECINAIEAPCKLRIMSYNILSKHYDGMQKRENTWENRKNRVIELIAYDSPDIMCCQELTEGQIFDLMQTLGDKYAVYAPLPLDTGSPNTELLGIFYKKLRFDLRQSEIKELGCMYYWEEYQNYCFQYFIKAMLLDKTTGKELMVYNTHADYLKADIRLQLVHFLLNDAEKEALKYPTVIAGDFNTLPSILPDSIHASLITGLDGSYLLQTIANNNFKSSQALALIAHAGPVTSYTYQIKTRSAFSGIDPYGPLLDHIFVTPQTMKVIFHAIDPATVNGHFPSDHLPVLADIAIP